MKKTYIAITTDAENTEMEKFDNLEVAKGWIEKWKEYNQKLVNYFEIEEGLEIEYTIVETENYEDDGWLGDYQIIHRELTTTKRTER